MSSSISGWVEGILLSILFIGVLALVVGNFNILYHQNNNIGLEDNSTYNSFVDYSANSQNLTDTGQVILDSNNGVTLKSSYGIMKDAINIVWGFISGGWVEKIINMIGLGEAGVQLAKILRILFFLSLIFAILYAMFKIVV